MKGFSTRLAFALVSLLTLVLLVGSAVLQQIVFRAEQHFSSLYLSPTSFQLAEGQVLELTVTSATLNQVSTSGLQLSLTFESSKLSYQQVVPPIGWRTLALQDSSDRLEWVLVPDLGQVPLVSLQGEVPLGKIRFLAEGSGVTNVTINQNGTALAAVDPAEGNLVYNALESAQGSAGTITASTPGQLTFPETVTATPTSPEIPATQGFGGQKVLSAYAETTSDAALIFVTLAHPGKVTVEFGTTEGLGNKVESTQEQIHHVITVANLTAGESYFYRVVGEQASGQSRVATAAQAFETRLAGTGSVSRESGVVVFPQRVKQTGSVYIFPRDEAGASLSNATPLDLDTAGQAEAGPIRSLGGYHYFELSNPSGEKLVVQLTPRFADLRLESRSLLFDPELTDPEVKSSHTELVLSWNRQMMALTLGGAILLFLLMLLFVRLSKGR